MTYDKQALIDLRDKVKAGEFDARTYPLMKLPQMQMETFDLMHAAYNGSIDAAKALHEAVLDGWGWRFSDMYGDGMPPKYEKKTAWVSKPHNWRVGHTADVVDGNEARAWLIAILEALIAETNQ